MNQMMHGDTKDGQGSSRKERALSLQEKDGGETR